MKLDGAPGRRARARARGAARKLRSHGEDGSTLVEFAIVLPGLMTLLTGVISFSLAFYSLQQLGNATANAVQQVAEYQGLYPVTIGTSSYDPCELALYEVTTNLKGWNTALFSYKLTITDETGTATPYSSTSGTSFTCPDGDSSTTAVAANEPVVLQVTYAYQWMPILNFLPKSSLTSVQGAVGGE